MNGVVALTDQHWYDFLSSRAVNGRLDEVNFWRPKSQFQFRQLSPGEPFFLRLKSPHYAIAGYGFFATWELLPLHMAWEVFREKNGTESFAEFLERLRMLGRTEVDIMGPNAIPVGCIILRDVHFLPKDQWIPWGEGEEWSRSIQVEKCYDLTIPPGVRLMQLIQSPFERIAPEFFGHFVPVQIDERSRREIVTISREGQGSFRLRLLDAYGRRCAITGERTVPVLDAAHIQPYLGPASNHIQNGLLLRSDLHELYDLGYFTVTPNYRVEVSKRIREEFENGRDYYAFHGCDLRALPQPAELRPSKEALRWHCECVYR